MGSGRSEVMETIFGYRQKTEGEILLRGKPIEINGPKDAIGRKIGFLTEDRKRTGLFLPLSVADNVIMSDLRTYNNNAKLIDNKKVRQACEDQREILRIKTPSIDQTINNLSGGNQQKVLIARWLLMDPDILIIDEPTRGIDIGAKSEIHKIMSQLAGQGKAIIMVSSELPEVLGMSDRIMVMHEGHITGGIDLSLGSVVALAGVITASFAAPGQPVIIAVLMGLLVGVACGLFNGTVLALTGIPPFIVTLGMYTAARGAALLYTGGRPISDLSDEFLVIGTGSLGFLPIPVLIFLAMAVITHILLRRTQFGRTIYAYGGNEEAAKVCGINVSRVIVLVYVYGSTMAAIGGIILTSRVSSGNPTAGIGYELDAIASAVIGGTSLDGGIGFITGTVIGALIIGVLNNGLTLMGVDPNWQQIAKAVIIVGAVIMDSRRRRTKH